MSSSINELLKKIAEKIEDEEPLTFEEAEEFVSNCQLVSHERSEEIFKDEDGIPKDVCVMQYIKLKFLNKEYELEYATPLNLTGEEICYEGKDYPYEVCFDVENEDGDLVPDHEVLEEFFSDYVEDIDIAPFEEMRQKALKDKGLRQEDLEKTLKDDKNWIFSYEIDGKEFTQNDKDYSKLFYFFSQAYNWVFGVTMTAHYDNGIFNYFIILTKNFEFIGQRLNPKTNYNSIYINGVKRETAPLSFDDLKNHEYFSLIAEKIKNPYFLYASYEAYLQKMNIDDACDDIIKYYEETYGTENEIIGLIKDNGLRDTTKNIYSELTEIVEWEGQYFPRFAIVINDRFMFSKLEKIVRKHVDVFLGSLNKKVNDRFLFRRIFVYVKKLLSYEAERYTKKIHNNTLRLMNDYNEFC